MRLIKGLMISFVSFFFTMMMVIFIVRMAKGLSPFVGLSEVLAYFDNIDVLTPLEKWNNNMVDILSTYDKLNAQAILNNPVVNNVGDVFKLIKSGFESFGEVFRIMLYFMRNIFYFLIDCIIYVVESFSSIFGFFTYVNSL